MAKLYFRYGLGKSSQVCQVAYNYMNQRKMKVAIINAKDNEAICSNISVDGDNVLVRKPNLLLDEKPLYKRLYFFYKRLDMKCVLVDNAEYLTEEQAEDLFYASKILDVPVIAYGNRLLYGIYPSPGVCRLMALADSIEKIDMVLPSKKATLDFNYGAMNCSKTAQMLTKDQALADYGFKTFIVKPKSDREELYVSSRIGLKKKADLVMDPSDSIYCQGDYLTDNKYNYVLVDEAQFLTEKQINQLRKLVDDYNIPVSCYGLKVDFLSNLFEGSKRLLEVSDNIYKLKTVCSCGRGANFNVRKNDAGDYVTEGEQVCIDTGANYDSECPYCFMEHVMGINLKTKSVVTRVRKK